MTGVHDNGNRDTPDARRFFPVSEPALIGREREYVLDCLDSTWISSHGAYIARFEERFAAFCGVEHAVACANGTVALHLALLALGVGPGDEVIVPALTYVASANAVRYCGATPVFVDSEPATWNIDATLIEPAITSRTKAIMAVHLYGCPAGMDAIDRIAARRGLAVVEDAAEAHGAEHRGRRAGALGRIAAFSFYGNKIVTTGEGGIVTTNDPCLAERVRLLRGQGQDPERRYWFPIVGYNYRLTNIAAAIGVAQLELIDEHLARRRRVADWYAEELAGLPGVTTQPEPPGCRHVYWMNSVLLAEALETPASAVQAALLERGVDTRPFFPPIHTLPPYRNARSVAPVAESLARRGFNLPSHGNLTRADVAEIAGHVREAVLETTAAPAPARRR